MRKVLFILGQLSDEDVLWIARAGRPMEAAAGQALITMGRKIDDVVIVLDGKVQVSVGGQVLARLGRGEILGEMSLIEDALPSANATTMGPAALLLVPIAALREKLAADTAFAARFYKAVALFLSDRMRGTVAQLGYGEVPRFDELNELDGAVMDSLHLAGQRFLSILDSMMASHERQ